MLASVETSEQGDVRRRSSNPDGRTDGQTCSLGVCSYVLETLEVVNLARNYGHSGATNLDIARMGLGGS